MREWEGLALAPLQNGLSFVESSNDHKSIDRAAIWLSGLCLVHCLAVPLAFLLAPSLSAWLDATETQTHWILFGLAVPISGVALYRGYRREPNQLTVTLGILGLLLMLLGVTHLFGGELEIVLTTAGVILVMFAHLRNLHAGHEHQASSS
jgi:hypothetical protein